MLRLDKSRDASDKQLFRKWFPTAEILLRLDKSTDDSELQTISEEIITNRCDVLKTRQTYFIILREKRNKSSETVVTEGSALLNEKLVTSPENHSPLLN